MRFRRPVVYSAAAALAAIFLIAATFLLGIGEKKAEILHALANDCTLDGIALSAKPIGVDIAIDPKVLPIVGTDSNLHPVTLIRTGVAKRVLFENRLYSLNGPFLSSRPATQSSLQSGWLVSASMDRRLTWRRSARRVSVMDGSAQEVAFVEYARGTDCTATSARPLGVIAAFGIHQDGPSLPNEMTARGDEIRLSVAWRDGNGVGRTSSGTDSCKRAVNYSVDWSMHIQISAIELHPSARPFLLCDDDSLFVVQHRSRSPSDEENILVINRFNTRSGTWMGTSEVAAPPGMYLADVAKMTDLNAMRILVVAGLGSGNATGSRVGLIQFGAMAK